MGQLPLLRDYSLSDFLSLYLSLIVCMLGFLFELISVWEKQIYSDGVQGFLFKLISVWEKQIYFNGVEHFTPSII